MKKSFKFYIIIWAVLLAVYNLVVFVVRPIIPGVAINYDVRFWIAWGFIIATYIGQLLCAMTAFNSKNLDKFFLKIPLITQSYSAVIAACIAGSILMLIPNCPVWIATIVCAVVFAFCIISVVRAKAAVDIVSDIDDKIKTNTFFIKALTVDAESLMERAKSESAKTAAKKVYEAVRYSDPMSNDVLASLESEIAVRFAKFSEAIVADYSTATAQIADELVILIGDRNKKCKLLK
ncbi:MAG: hypothetical protein IJO93_03180 [Clostridia bacterium]|nr:hypothetical protein [Clostridia bacterium]